MLVAQEAVTHYETILAEAGERQGAFLADAVRTLVEAQVARGSHSDALAALVRALRLLKPRYESVPDLWQSSVLPLCVRYVQLSEAAGKAIDPSLVENVIVRAQQEAAAQG